MLFRSESRHPRRWRVWEVENDPTHPLRACRATPLGLDTGGARREPLSRRSRDPFAHELLSDTRLVTTRRPGLRFSQFLPTSLVGHTRSVVWSCRAHPSRISHLAHRRRRAPWPGPSRGLLLRGVHTNVRRLCARRVTGHTVTQDSRSACARLPLTHGSARLSALRLPEPPGAVL